MLVFACSLFLCGVSGMWYMLCVLIAWRFVLLVFV